MPGVVLLLEDDSDRLERFQAVAVRLGVELVVWRDAHRMIAEMGAFLPGASLISLDHDLEPEGSADPGDGLDVAKHLAALPPGCAAIVHTSNGVRGDAMVGELDLAGWPYERIYPLGDDWIEVDWYRVVRRRMQSQSRGKK
jgi:hypothetical protein